MIWTQIKYAKEWLFKVKCEFQIERKFLFFKSSQKIRCLCYTFECQYLAYFFLIKKNNNLFTLFPLKSARDRRDFFFIFQVRIGLCILRFTCADLLLVFFLSSALICYASFFKTFTCVCVSMCFFYLFVRF